MSLLFMKSGFNKNIEKYQNGIIQIKDNKNDLRVIFNSLNSLTIDILLVG